MENGRKTVQVINASKNGYAFDKLRVAAYCRVSTSSEDQLNSFFAQMQYYNDFIRENEGMVLVDIYADEGITGMVVEKRDEFKRMMNDAKNGKIDRIFVKSVQRFARNSLECIEAIRELASYGTSVYFENDKIDTAGMNSEMMLYVKSAFAQSESLSHSRRMKLATKMKMENGTYYNAVVPYGYKTVNRELVIVPEEAEKVRTVFRLYCSGVGPVAITKYMKQHETTDFVWTIGRIRWMLGNERYMGDAMLGKTYTPEKFPLHSAMNKGQSDRFFWESANVPIISKEEFENVQKIMASRCGQFRGGDKKEYFFSGKIHCRKCGWAYRSLMHGGELSWKCSHKGHSLDVCVSPSVKDREMRKAFVCMVNRLKKNEKFILDEMIQQLQQLRIRITSGEDAIATIDGEIMTLSTQSKSYAGLYANGVMDEAIFLEKTDKIKKKITELRSRRLKLLREDENEKCIEEFRMIKRALDEYDGIIEEFSEDLFDRMVECVIGEQNGDICFRLKGGLELPIGRVIWRIA